MSEDAGFTGKVVAIWSKEPAQGGLLENVCVRRLDQRAFLVGQVAEVGKESDPRVGSFLRPSTQDAEKILRAQDFKKVQRMKRRGEGEGEGERQDSSRWRFCLFFLVLLVLLLLLLIF